MKNACKLCHTIKKAANMKMSYTANMADAGIVCECTICFSQDNSHVNVS